MSLKKSVKERALTVTENQGCTLLCACQKISLSWSLAGNRLVPYSNCITSKTSAKKIHCSCDKKNLCWCGAKTKTKHKIVLQISLITLNQPKKQWYLGPTLVGNGSLATVISRPPNRLVLWNLRQKVHCHLPNLIGDTPFQRNDDAQGWVKWLIKWVKMFGPYPFVYIVFRICRSKLHVIHSRPLRLTKLQCLNGQSQNVRRLLEDAICLTKRLSFLWNLNGTRWNFYSHRSVHYVNTW